MNPDEEKPLLAMKQIGKTFAGVRVLDLTRVLAGPAGAVRAASTSRKEP